MVEVLFSYFFWTKNHTKIDDQVEIGNILRASGILNPLAEDYYHLKTNSK